uniref:uncharacterized protein isoform X2 n=1 Tax=Myxine glutinosa TaxID=7769 RepID=UPI00358F8A42
MTHGDSSRETSGSLAPWVASRQDGRSSTKGLCSRSNGAGAEGGGSTSSRSVGRHRSRKIKFSSEICPGQVCGVSEKHARCCISHQGHLFGAITDQESFDRAKRWLRELLEQRWPDMVMALVGNKTDLDNRRAVSNEEAGEYAREQNILFMEVSAKTGANVQEIFTEVGRTYLERRQQQSMEDADLWNESISLSQAWEAVEDEQRGCCH